MPTVHAAYIESDAAYLTSRLVLCDFQRVVTA